MNKDKLQSLIATALNKEQSYEGTYHDLVTLAEMYLEANKLQDVAKHLQKCHFDFEYNELVQTLDISVDGLLYKVKYNCLKSAFIIKDSFNKKIETDDVLEFFRTVR